MDVVTIEDISLTNLKIIKHPKGNIYHALKKGDRDFVGFGEAYFSTINKNEIKGWKKHLKMKMNIIVPVGEVSFVLFDDRRNSKSVNNFFSITLSPFNVSVSPKVETDIVPSPPPELDPEPAAEK